jgi:hypothetical protein
MWKQIGSGLLHSDSRPDVSPHLGREAERILASLVNGGYETQTRLVGTMRNNDRQGGEANQPTSAIPLPSNRSGKGFLNTFTDA